MYRAIGGPTLSRRQSAVDEFETVEGGLRLARSVGGAVTGRGGDYLIFDDLAPAEHATNAAARATLNEKISTTLMSRGNSLNDARILVVAQRLHEDDATGRFLREGGWEHLAVPSIAVADERWEYDTEDGPVVHLRKKGEVLMPELGTIEAYDRLRRSMPPVEFEAMYQQNPVPAAGHLVKLSWFPRFTTPPEKFDQVVMAWDTASKVEETNDYSASVTFGRLGGQAWLLEVFRDKLEYPELKEAIRQRQKRHRADVVLIEDAGSGQNLLADLKRDGLFKVQGVKAQQHKELRLRAATSMMAEGRIYFPKQEMWSAAFEGELLSFPIGRHDDMVDAFVHAITWMKENPPLSFIEMYYKEEFEGMNRLRPQVLCTIQSPSKMWANPIPLGKEQMHTDEFGIIALSEEDALPLIRSAGWTLLHREVVEPNWR